MIFFGGGELLNFGGVTVGYMDANSLWNYKLVVNLYPITVQLGL